MLIVPCFLTTVWVKRGCVSSAVTTSALWYKNVLTVNYINANVVREEIAFWVASTQDALLCIPFCICVVLCPEHICVRSINSFEFFHVLHVLWRIWRIIEDTKCPELFVDGSDIWQTCLTISSVIWLVWYSSLLACSLPWTEVFVLNISKPPLLSGTINFRLLSLSCPQVRSRCHTCMLVNC